MSNDKFRPLFLPENEGRVEKWEQLGLLRVKADLENNGGTAEVGGTLAVRNIAWLWVEYKEYQVQEQSKKITFNKILNNPWTIGIGGGLIVAFISWLVSYFF